MKPKIILFKIRMLYIKIFLLFNFIFLSVLGYNFCIFFFKNHQFLYKQLNKKYEYLKKVHSVNLYNLLMSFYKTNVNQIVYKEHCTYKKISTNIKINYKFKKENDFIKKRKKKYERKKNKISKHIFYKKKLVKYKKLIWPTHGKIISNFSYINGGNKGIDILGLPGQDIVSIDSGYVVYEGNSLHGYGNLIIIKHSNNYLSAYAHNEKVFVHKKQKVQAGERIAIMGSTGAHCAKLHFVIAYKGKLVNPLDYLPTIKNK